MMKNYKITIKAKTGYHVKSFVDTQLKYKGRKIRFLYDGDQAIMSAFDMSYEDFLDNLEENEMFGYLEVFKTMKGNKFIYARDNEIDEDYLIKIPTEERMNVQ